jgi:hypothetical protein
MIVEEEVVKHAGRVPDGGILERGRRVVERRILAGYETCGAEEFWTCDDEGALTFFLKTAAHTPVAASQLCPGFPARLELD